MRDIVDSMHTINMKLYKSVSYCKNTKIFIFHITCVETVKNFSNFNIPNISSGGTAQIFLTLIFQI